MLRSLKGKPPSTGVKDELWNEVGRGEESHSRALPNLCCVEALLELFPRKRVSGADQAAAEVTH